MIKRISRIVRTEHGKVVPGHKFVASDVIGAFAGVSAGSVIKVLIAVNKVQEITGVPYAQLLDIESLPLGSPNTVRINETESFVQRMASDDRWAPVSDFLKLNRLRQLAA